MHIFKVFHLFSVQFDNVVRKISGITDYFYSDKITNHYVCCDLAHGVCENRGLLIKLLENYAWTFRFGNYDLAFADKGFKFPGKDEMFTVPGHKHEKSVNLIDNFIINGPDAH